MKKIPDGWRRNKFALDVFIVRRALLDHDRTKSNTVYRAVEGLIAQYGEDCFLLPETNYDVLFQVPDVAVWLREQIAQGKPVLRPEKLLPPLVTQDISATRDDHFEKGFGFMGADLRALKTPDFGPGDAIPMTTEELNFSPAIVAGISTSGHLIGYTVANLISRSSEAVATVGISNYALGPGLTIRGPINLQAGIRLEIVRNGTIIAESSKLLGDFAGWCQVAFYSRTCEIGFQGCYLALTFPFLSDAEVKYENGDVIRVVIDEIGTLENVVQRG